MSKIYQALEKAEKERQKDFKKELPSMPEFQELESEKQEVEIEPKTIKLPSSNQPLVSYYEPGSLAAEQIRKLRSYILKHNDKDSPRTIMVTSALNGEGKTFVSANLAAGLANDLRTQALLIDCDLRNPSLSDWFDVPKYRGLSDYLGGNGTAFSEFIIRTDLEKLRVIPAGSIKENPTELIGSKKMEVLVQELRLQVENRYIIFDSTPILATTEPQVLGKLVDGIIFVVRAGVTPRETIQQAIRALDGAKIIGVVLNDLTFRSSGLYSRYFGSDGYYYKYGYRRKNEGPAGNNGKLSRWLRSKKRESGKSPIS